ncbi:serine/threonine-protein kinase [Streptomyces sp. 71268]|uniref:serine/threonine-protein kinase n=1 Tax=Streptomyces sp. 71268 TaxID=3002640 RepID=UPI0023F8644B|nr:serine/threonine-protein kinase [Streptomyces sp. 71268]WEV27280.1 serine/threonine-protein kinase [Streptomyces sp. 71268]
MARNGGNARLIAGRYRLVGQLGRGGMGTVWRADDELLGRQVAVKELHLDEGLSALDAQARRERTLREARTVAQLKHPHVIVLHDVVEQDERPWIVMELVDGRSLADQIAESGPVGQREAARIVLALLDALGAAHARGVLHRDIKPANVLMEAGTGRVVLTDFGIAQVAGATTITETGTFVGSPEYTAPERMSGRRTGPESDLWSLGVLLCTLVSGESPFRRDSLGGVLHAVVFDEIRAPAQAGPLAPVVLGLLERDPARRLTAASATSLLRAYGAHPTSDDGLPLAPAAHAPRPGPSATRARPTPVGPLATGPGRGRRHTGRGRPRGSRPRPGERRPAGAGAAGARGPRGAPAGRPRPPADGRLAGRCPCPARHPRPWRGPRPARGSRPARRSRPSGRTGRARAGHPRRDAARRRRPGAPGARVARAHRGPGRRRRRRAGRARGRHRGAAGSG